MSAVLEFYCIRNAQGLYYSYQSGRWETALALSRTLILTLKGAQRYESYVKASQPEEGAKLVRVRATLETVD